MSKVIVLAAAIGLAFAASPGSSQTTATDDDEGSRLDRVVVTGTRVAGRSITDTPVAIDVVDVDQLERAGSTELNQVLSTALPSLNFPRPGLADGTDTIRPATLRGLGPDQTLVLVNSKRRHAASLVNVNGTIGRGASAVDLNTIPVSAVELIEVLRDGASAQYGSDAIAGVINVLLRRADQGGSLRLSYGQRESSYRTPTTAPPADATWSAPDTIRRSVSDGETWTVSGWKGFALGNSGFLTLSFEYKDQQRTERGGWDFRQQFPLLEDAFDPREQTIDRFNAWYGEPEVKQLGLFANAGVDLGDGARLYGWASWQDREARSAGFFRRAVDARNVIEIYPEGFLPIIAPDVSDASAAFGGEWYWGDWFMDSSIVYGRNKMAFTIENTLNASIGPTSPTVFDAGGFAYDQWAFNFSGTRGIDIDRLASPLNLSMGLEARREGYRIFAGEPDSYRFGGRLLPNGSPAAPGAQVFPGFRPGNEVSEHRRAFGAYVDLEAELSERLLGSIAVRAEDYSDFGSNLSGKLALRYNFTDTVALRGSLQNGFRAPAPQQQFFTATSTNFIDGVPFDITTFPVADPVAVALGAQPLDAEKSLNYSLGLVFDLGAASLTVDAYRIDVDDRIVLSENLTQTNVREYLASQGFVGIGGGRFFINGVDTQTHGIDAVLSWSWRSSAAGDFDFALSGNHNRTKVTRVPSTDPLSALDPAPVLFGRINVLSFEKGNPRNKYGLVTNWTLGNWGATLRANHYGRVLDPGTSAALDVTLSAKTVFDLEARYRFTENLLFAVGADNLFDAYPDAFPITRNATGNTPFSNYAPFGRSGRFLYARFAYDF